MANLSLDYILHEDWTFYQDHDQFCSNTDTKLLASFMDIRKNETVLDVGTNNGALLIAADHSNASTLQGVEILEDAYALACINAREFIRHPCMIHHSSLQNLEIEPVDVILSNPPYFQERATNPNVKMNARQMGRIEKNLTLEELIVHTNRLLKSNGRFYFVHRPNRCNEFFSLLHAHNMSVHRIQFAYHGQEAKSVCIEAIKERACDVQVLAPVFI